MPSNLVLINNAKEFIVMDSKMEEFLSWLRENGSVVETDIEQKQDEPVLVNSQN